MKSYRIIFIIELSIVSFIGCKDDNGSGPPINKYIITAVKIGPTAVDYQRGGTFYEAQISDSTQVASNVPFNFFAKVDESGATLQDAWYFPGATGCSVGNAWFNIYIPPRLIIRVTNPSSKLLALGFAITTSSVGGCSNDSSAVLHYQFQ